MMPFVSSMVGAMPATVGGGGGTDPYFSNVILLMGFDGADASTAFTDESSYGHSVTANGNAQIDTAQSKFGGSSLLLDGSGDYLSLADQALWDLGSADFTVECWVRPNAVSGRFLRQDGGYSAAAGWVLMWESNSLRFNTYATSQLQVYETVGSWTGPTGQWYHLAADRSGSTWRAYRDGVMVAKATRSGAIAGSNQPLIIGGPDCNGWMEEVRITKGVARYASDGGFTPPTAAFPRS